MKVRTGIAATTVVLVALLLVTGCGGDAKVTPTPSPTPALADVPIPNPWELYIGGVDGSSVRLVHASDLPPQYAWSADGGLLAVAEGDGTSATFRILDLEGGERAKYSHDGYPAGLSWSPDGHNVVTTYTTSEHKTGVMVMASAGSGQKPFPDVESSELYLSGWLPSGELMVANHEGMRSGNLFALDLEAGTFRVVTDVRAVLGYSGLPAVSPDRKTLALLGWAGVDPKCQVGDSAVLFTVDIETGVGRRLAQSPGCGSGSVVWSPDGTQIAFSSLTVPDRYGVFVVDVDSGETRRLTSELQNVVAWPEDSTILAHDYADDECVQCGDDTPGVVAIDSTTGDVVAVAGLAPNTVSPDGKIVIARDGVIEVLNADGTQLATIGGTEDGWRYRDLTLAPGGAHVAYQRSRVTGLHYFQVNGDGSNFEALGRYARHASLSPDLERVAYAELIAANGADFAAMFLADAGASNAQKLPLEVGVANFAWSPDSSRLVYTTRDPYAIGGEYIVNRDGTGIRKLDLGSATSEPNSLPPVWAPNGKSVLFVGALGTIVDVDSGALTQFDMTTDSWRNPPAWSSDSSKVVYAVSGEPDVAGLYVFDVATKQTIRIKVSGIPTGPLAVSPDGQRIAYYSNDDVTAGRLTLHVVGIDGTNDRLVMERALTTGAPAWSPDSQRLAAVKTPGSDRGLYILNADGSEAKQLTAGGDFDEIRWTDANVIVLRTYIENY